MEDLKKCSDEFNKMWDEIGEDYTIPYLIERGVFGRKYNIPQLIRFVQGELEYNYSDPTWREDEQNTPEFKKAKRKLKAFLKKWS